MRRFIAIKIVLVACVFMFIACNRHISNIKWPQLEELSDEIEAQMIEHNLLGITIAVIEDSKILWTKELGVKDLDSKESLDVNTAFSTASISKTITASVCLILDEQNKIDIDVPVRKYLKRWQLPDSEYLQKKDLTIRHLLAHIGGTTHGGYADFYEGDSDSIPDIVDCLNGKGLPNYESGVEIFFEPESDAYYSGGGYVIIQLALEDELKKSFAQIVDEVLIQPLNLAHTTMLQPNQKGFPENVAKCHDSQKQVIKTGLPICPQLAASGLWSTSKDLALFAIETQNALNGLNTKVISSKVAKELSEIITYKYMGGGALGWQRSFGFGNNDWLSIMGSNTGIGGEINITVNGKNGIVMLANGEMSNRLPVFNFIRNKIINQRGWAKEINTTLVKKVDEKIVEVIKGVYLDFLYQDENDIVTIIEENGQLFIISTVLKLLTGKEKSEMYYLGEHQFNIANYPNIVKFDISDTKITNIGICRNANERDKNIYWRPIESLKTIDVDLIEAFSFLPFEEAKKEYGILKQNNPDKDFTYSLLQLGVTFYKKGENDMAIKVLEYNCLEHPQNFDAYETCAQVYERLGKLNKAAEKYEQLLKLIELEEDKKEMKAKIKDLRKAKEQ